MITEDACRYRHECDWGGHLNDALPMRPESTIDVDYHFTCEVCGQRFHVTGQKYTGGSGTWGATRIGKPSRAWRKAQRHPRTTDPQTA